MSLVWFRCRIAIQEVLGKVADHPLDSATVIENVAEVSWTCIDSAATCDPSKWYVPTHLKTSIRIVVLSIFGYVCMGQSGKKWTS